MPDFKEKPEGEFIDQTKAYLEGLWRNAHSKWREYDLLLHRTYAVWPANHDGTKNTRAIYRPSTPTNIVSHAADNQLAFQPRVHRPPPNDLDQSKTFADSIEESVKSIFVDSGMQEMLLPWKQIGKHLVHYDYAVAEMPILDFHQWNNRPTEPVMGGDSVFGKIDTEIELKSAMAHYKAAKRNFNPIRFRVPHPARILLDPSMKSPPFGIKITKMPAWELQALTEHKRKPPGSKRARRDVQVYKAGEDLYEEIEIVHFWSNFWSAVKLASGDMLFIDENMWRFHPFIHAFGGLGGMEPTDVDESDPSFLIEGILGPIADSIKVEAQSATAKHELLMRAAFALQGTSRTPSEYAEALAKSGILEGEKTEYWTQEVQQMASWMFEIGREVSADIELGSSPRSLAGFRQPGVDTVGGQAILANAGKLKFLSPAMQLQHMASITGMRLLQLADVVPGLEISVNGNALKKSEIEHDYTLVITFEVVDPVIQLQQRDIGMRELAVGVKSTERYLREDARVENITEERQNLRQDALRARPAMQEIEADIAARELGMEEELAAARQLEEEEAKAGGGSRNGTAGLDGRERSQTEGQILREGLTGDTQNPPRFNFGR